MIFGTAGLYGFDITAANLDKFGWIWPAFFTALQAVSMVISTVVGCSYMIDAYCNYCLAISLLVHYCGPSFVSLLQVSYRVPNFPP